MSGTLKVSDILHFELIVKIIKHFLKISIKNITFAI